MKKAKCILFAAPVGAGKTPIAIFLSWNLDLPVFNNDAIRLELAENSLSGFNEEDQVRLRDKRLNEIFKSKKTIIVDASIDRIWKKRKEIIADFGYKPFIISIDISKKHLLNLYKSRGYDYSEESVLEFFEDHQNFLKTYPQDVSLSLNDKNYNKRMELAKKAVERYLRD